MSLSSAKIYDHAVIEQFNAAEPPRLPELPRQLCAPPLGDPLLGVFDGEEVCSSYWPRSRAGPPRPREQFARSA
jgi:hypothetical protein